MKKELSKSFAKFLPFLTLAVFFPAFAFAQTTVFTLLTKVNLLLDAIVPVLLGIGIIYFIWGVIKYVIANGEEDKKKGREVMIYGVIGFAVISALWGLVSMVVEALGGQGMAPVAPTGTCTAPASGAALQEYLSFITCIINKSIIPVIFALAAVLFIWGVVKFFFINTGNETERAQGKQFMIWGIIALAVMLSMWGLVGALSATFGIDSVLPKANPPGFSSVVPAPCGSFSCPVGEACHAVHDCKFSV